MRRVCQNKNRPPFQGDFTGCMTQG
jgi:hypothetical protein